MITQAPDFPGAKLQKKMYIGKRKILRLEEYNNRRKDIIADKCGATWNAFTELEGLINKSALAEQYFEKSHSWLSQRIHGCTVRKKSMTFKENEYHELAEAFRDIAKRLVAHADEIDNARTEDSSSMK